MSALAILNPLRKRILIFIFILAFLLIGGGIASFDWFLLVILALFIAALIITYPVLGVILLMPVGILLSGFYVGAFPLRYYLLAFLFLIWISRLRSSLNLLKNKYMANMIIVLGMYLVWAFTKEVLYSDFGSGIKTVSGSLLQGVMTAWFAMVFSQNKEDIKRIVLGISIWVILSAFIAIMQFLEIPFFIDLGKWVWQFVSDEQRRSYGLSIQPIGRTGLSGTTLALGYTISFVTPLMLSFYLDAKKFIQKLLLLLFIIILIIGCAFTLVMSSIVGLIVSFLLVIWLWGKLKLQWGILAIGLCLAIMIIMDYLFPGLFVEKMFDRDGQARIPLFIVGIQVAINNPLGIPITEYFSYAKEYMSTVVGLNGYEFVLRTLPHNNYLNVWVNYGIPGIFLYVIFYFLLFKGMFRLLRITQASNSKYKSIITGLIGAFIANLFNAFTHNAGLFKGETIAWFGVGVFWAVYMIINPEKFFAQQVRNKNVDSLFKKIMIE